MSTRIKPTHAYVGIAFCGCIMSASVDNPEHAKEVRRDVREFMKLGHVERLPLEVVREAFCLDGHYVRVGRQWEYRCPHPNACPHRNTP